MSHYVTGAVLRQLREGKHYTQKQLAELLAVSDKTVSKWETERGLPDITLLEPLAAALGVSVPELLHGQPICNHNRAGSPRRGHFFVCPVCGNVLYALGAGAFHCCGIPLPPLEPEAPDPDHCFTVTPVENEWYVASAHPMTKTHYLTFLAYVTADRVQLVKLYPQQEAAARFARSGSGELYACCNRHGLFRLPWPART